MFGLVTAPDYLEHETPEGHPERPARLLAAERGLARAGLVGAAGSAAARMTTLAPRLATDAELTALHTPELVAAVEGLAASGGGAFDADTWVSPRSAHAARLAAGGVVAMTEWLLAGRGRRAMALVRPPGHHATAARAMGFCLFNNVAVAARAAQRAHGLERVLIVDWDVHHGNGTQEIFWRDGGVGYFSVHQWPLYPGTGRASERGEGPGTGFILNVPVPAGSGDAVFLDAIGPRLAPLWERVAPQLVLVSAGFDAHEDDPLGGCRVTTQGFAEMARRLSERAGEVPIGFVLEGGYDLGALEECVPAVVRATSL